MATNRHTTYWPAPRQSRLRRRRGPGLRRRSRNSSRACCLTSLCLRRGTLHCWRSLRLLLYPQLVFPKVGVVVTFDSSVLFRQLGSEDLNLLRRIVREQQFSSGSQIFKEGDLGDG